MNWEQFKQETGKFENLYQGNLNSFESHGETQLQYRDWQGELQIFPKEDADKVASRDAAYEVQHNVGKLIMEARGMKFTGQFRSNGIVELNARGNLEWEKVKEYFGHMKVNIISSRIGDSEVVTDAYQTINDIDLDSISSKAHEKHVDCLFKPVNNLVEIIGKPYVTEQLEALRKECASTQYAAVFFSFCAKYGNMDSDGYRSEGNVHGLGHNAKITIWHYTRKADNLDWLVVGK